MYGPEHCSDRGASQNELRGFLDAIDKLVRGKAVSCFTIPSAIVVAGIVGLVLGVFPDVLLVKVIGYTILCIATAGVALTIVALFLRAPTRVNLIAFLSVAAVLLLMIVGGILAIAAGIIWGKLSGY